MILRISILLAAALSVWILAACDSEGPASVREGNQAFEVGEYEQAREAYDRALEAMPDSPQATYNSANVFYKQDQFGEAHDRYDGSVETARAELSQKATYNTGNSLYQSEEYEGAIEAYKQALRLDPTDTDAKHNLELALKRIEEQQQQEQENQEQQQQEGQEQGQEEEEEGEQQAPGQQPQDQEPQPQDQEQPQDQGEQNSQQDEPSEEMEPEEGESSSTQSPSDPGEVPPTGMTEEQAEQLLESVADSAETLRSRIMTGDIQDILAPPVERDW